MPQAYAALRKIRGPHTALDIVQGRWRRYPDGQPMGEIRNGLIHWHDDFTQTASRISITVRGDLEMDLLGQRYFGHLQGKTIRWSDGEIWTFVP